MDHNSNVTTSCLVYIVFLIVVINYSDAFVLGKVGNYAVLRGMTVTLQCIPRDIQARELPEDGTTYVWTDEEGKDLIEARYTKLESGDLEIVNAHVGDSGTFKCKVRPPAVHTTAGTTVSKVYEHKLIVYELAGHKFVSSIVVDLSRYSMEIILTILNDLLTGTVCGVNLCLPGIVKAKECESSDMVQQRCAFSMPYAALNQIADEQCDEECVRMKMFDGLKRAERILETVLVQMADDPTARLKPDMRTFDTKHLVTCRAGFHLVKSFFKRCFPCLPGHYSKPNSSKCEMCKIGYYQEKYGKHDCNKCEGSKSTDTMGAKSRDECLADEKTGILGNIREGIVSLFQG